MSIKRRVQELFVVILFITAENLKQPLNWKEPGEWINEFRYSHTVEYCIAKLKKRNQTTYTSNKDTSQKYDIDQKKLDTKGLIQYDSFYI